MTSNFFYSVLSKIGQLGEVTVEVNPENADVPYLEELKSAGVNRVSLGIQTFSDDLLKFLGRNHSSQQGLKALENILSVFNNVSVDIMFGIPRQTVSSLEKDLELILSFPIKHVSAYAFTLYEGTPFYKCFSEKDLPEDEMVERMYLLIREVLVSEGFFHYEISNFAKKGYECRHNLHYWHLNNYEGLGPSAASFIGNVYRKNVANLSRYFTFLRSGKVPLFEEVSFSEEDLKEIKLLMGLRLLSGIDLEVIGIRERFEERRDGVKFLEKEGYLEYNSPVLRLTEKACFVSNYVISELTKVLF